MKTILVANQDYTIQRSLRPLHPYKLRSNNAINAVDGTRENVEPAVSVDKSIISSRIAHPFKYKVRFNFKSIDMLLTYINLALQLYYTWHLQQK